MANTVLGVMPNPCIGKSVLCDHIGPIGTGAPFDRPEDARSKIPTGRVNRTRPITDRPICPKKNLSLPGLLVLVMSKMYSRIKRRAPSKYKESSAGAFPGGYLILPKRVRTRRRLGRQPIFFPTFRPLKSAGHDIERYDDPRGDRNRCYCY